MKSKLAALTGILLLCCTGFGSSQSLADLARKEQERRQQAKGEGRVITTQDVKKTASSTTPVRPSKKEPDLPKGDKTGTESKASDDEPVDFQGRPESFWRQTMTDARQKVKDLEGTSTEVTLRLTGLQNQFYSESNGFRQQEIQREIQKTFYEQDLIKQNLDKAREQLDDLEKEARKSGALPGWLMPKNP
jgi:hypothetical protein